VQIPPKPPEFKQGEDETALEGTGINPLPTPLTYVPLVSGSGYNVAVAYTSPAGAATVNGFTNQTAAFDSTGRLTQFGSDSIASGSHADFGSDGILAWGRWIGTLNIAGGTVTYGANEGFHYVIGVPTATMPTSGTATYALIGASNPTYMSGATGPGMVTGGSICASFTSFSVNGNLQNITVQMPDRLYTMTGFFCSAGSSFSGSGSVGGCATACSSQFSGFFAGASAERIGLGYKINDGPQNVLGAAAFAK
jgi:hypothetical protein